MGLDISHYIPSTQKQLDYFTKSELMINPEYVEKYKDLFVLNDDGDEILYVEEIGYQRKSMTYGFIKTFVNDRPYFTVDDVIEAGKFLSPKSETMDELKQKFTANFLDNFIEGKSFFAANW
ncbi:hypothetical protein IM792_12200 [Mucilaginibacter sp. JRF]|uniref:hypothetical protein n=1 Tax=Mucilaginibacter sp. JRF TaxID=2780088 RepID=UPI00187EBB65|nr:hypothetical protein [Mucilaginibacter sp. JRF]MBE9585213.1 hypothetical protein [Mucilaginibacter sp. JRF]